MILRSFASFFHKLIPQFRLYGHGDDAFKAGPSFQHYTGGILQSRDCESTVGNFGWLSVSLIGFGVEGSKEFWLGRNSMGLGWGEGGYFRAKRNVTWCAIANDPIAGFV
ncbi:unnamed protein product [Caenorhabditis auriculariae]|uniref:Peptidase C1A papain C-terminal domain-containing protein n=1 Tax=Caenorhabditis auriculariae TaxID=2777116 RepID=A0A8S1H917_9PELO|nr:unnamed protein product [Caenorhabditis auriculariae]